MRSLPKTSMVEIVDKADKKDQRGGYGRPVGAQHEEGRDRHGDRCGQGDSDGGDTHEDRRDSEAADQQAEGKSQREDVERARFGNALGDEVTARPT